MCLVSAMTQESVYEMLSERLRELLQEYGWNIQDLADMTDLPLETIRNIYYGKVKDPKVSTVMAISKVLHISVNYLMGESINTKQEEMLIRHYRKCGQHGKSVVNLIAKYEADLAKTERESQKEKHRIPCVVPFGSISEGIKYTDSEVVDEFTDNKEAYLAIEITSNALAPIYFKGDRILVEDRFPESGEKAFFSKDCILYCKKYIETHEGAFIQSLNKHTSDLEQLGEMDCVGTCIGVIRK